MIVKTKTGKLRRSYPTKEWFMLQSAKSAAYWVGEEVKKCIDKKGVLLVD